MSLRNHLTGTIDVDPPHPNGILRRRQLVTGWALQPWARRIVVGLSNRRELVTLSSPRRVASYRRRVIAPSAIASYPLPRHIPVLSSSPRHLVVASSPRHHLVGSLARPSVRLEGSGSRQRLNAEGRGGRRWPGPCRLPRHNDMAATMELMCVAGGQRKRGGCDNEAPGSLCLCGEGRNMSIWELPPMERNSLRYPPPFSPSFCRPRWGEISMGRCPGVGWERLDGMNQCSKGRWPGETRERETQQHLSTAAKTARAFVVAAALAPPGDERRRLGDNEGDRRRRRSDHRRRNDDMTCPPTTRPPTTRRRYDVTASKLPPPQDTVYMYNEAAIFAASATWRRLTDGVGTWMGLSRISNV
ncbi:hypothetical protein BJ912DRAFT_1059374 [Pholiota molesta]|nr:hypothetical protein BJ912DRAFT_1059374 [Pholiota molesta]